VKLLLLGAGESGKSTLLKQMKLIYGEGFTGQDKENAKDVICLNIVLSLQTILNAIQDNGNKPMSSEVNNNHADYIKKLKAYETRMSPQLQAAVKSLWADPVVQEQFQNRQSLQISEHCGFFFDNIDRMSAAGYVPTEEDILLARMPTTGIAEANFNLEHHAFRVLDVGGQRSERRKWVSCFPDVNMVVFVAAVSEIDQTLYEDNGTNRFHEALNLFEETINNDFFFNTPIVLFLNKSDVLKRKLEKGVDPKICFPDYDGGCDFDLATAYMKNQFLNRNKNPKRDIFVRLTNATDKNNMKFVFKAVTAMIFKGSLQESGII